MSELLIPGVLSSAGYKYAISVAHAGIRGNAGALLYKNDSNTAVVMEWLGLNNAQKRVAIALAASRPGKFAMGGYAKDLSLTNFNNAYGADGSWYMFNKTTTSPTADMPTMTNEQFRIQWANLATDGTCHANTQAWIDECANYYGNGVTGSPAADAARGVFIDGRACDLPNAETLMMMWLNSEHIDSLDDTAVANPTKALGKNINPYGRFHCENASGRAWACTEADASDARFMSDNGGCYKWGKSAAFIVLPVLEL